MSRYNLKACEEWFVRGFCLAAGATVFVVMIHAAYEALHLFWRSL